MKPRNQASRAPWVVPVFPAASHPGSFARLPVPVEVSLYPAPLAEAALYGVLAAAMFTLWPLARTERVRAAALYRDAATGGAHWPRWYYVVLTVGILGALIAAAAVFSGLLMLTLALGRRRGLADRLIVIEQANGIFQ